MHPAARTSFFIVLSVSLHFAVVSFDFTAPGLPSQAPPVGVNYVSRSLHSFYPAATLLPATYPAAKPPSPLLAGQALASIPSTPQKQGKIDYSGDVTVSSPPDTVTPDLSPSLRATVNGRGLPAEILPTIKITDYADNDATDVQWTTAEGSDFGREETGLTSTSRPISSPVAEPELSLSAEAVAPVGMTAQLESSDNSRQQISHPVGERAGAAEKISTNALPRYDLNPPPHYPAVAKLRNWEGKVVFEALILKSGRVGQLTLLASSGYKSLDSAARKAIHRWQFKPAISSGIAIDSQVEIPITFSLKNL